MTLHLNPNHWYCMEVQLNVTLYSGKPVMTFCQYLHTSPTILFQFKSPLDWSFDVHLMCSNLELNGIVLKVKQDTGAQINVLSKMVFQTLQKDYKLPKTCVKLVGYGNKVTNYLGTTKIKCNHNGTEMEAIFYITDVPDTKIILGL